MDNPVAAITPSKKTLGMGLKIFIWILVFGLLTGLVYWFFFLKRISWKEIKRLVGLESARYTGNEISTERILLQGAKEIISSPHLIRQAREFSNAHKIAIERVIVDNAIAMAKNMGYIPANPKTTIEPGPKPVETNSVQ